MDAKEINRIAWNNEVEKRNYWTIPVNHEEILDARKKEIKIHLTPMKYMPPSFLEGTGKRTLLLGGGGGQQGPLLAAYGKSVTVVDISERQLENDQIVCEREDLEITTVNADMCSLDFIEDGSFDFVMIPESINFISELDKLYSEVDRVLKKDGVLIISFANPALYIFDVKKLERGKLKIKYTLPFNSEVSLSRKEIERKFDTMEYSHTLDEIIGGLLKRNFTVIDFYTDGSDTEPIDSYLVDCYIAMKLIKR